MQELLIIGMEIPQSPNIDDIIDFHLFLLCGLILFNIRSIIVRSEYRIIVDPQNIKKNLNVRELPILFRIFPLSLFFVYNVTFYFSDDLNSPVAMFFLPRDVILLKKEIEENNLNYNFLKFGLIMLKNDLTKFNPNDSSDIPYIESTEWEISESSKEVTKELCLLRKMESLFLLFLPSYIRKSI
jgi:hypothetical protein